MLVNIIKIDGDKLTVEKDKVQKTHEMADFVVAHAKLGPADISINAETSQVQFISMQPTEEKPTGPTPGAIRKPASSVAKPIAKKKYMVNISGKDFMTYAGLLDKAHTKSKEEKGIFSIVITESFVSEDMTRAWCKVRLTAETEKTKQTFDGFGSSTPENTGKMTQSHPIEMAHTRAKGRALRDFVNIGEAMAEELK